MSIAQKMQEIMDEKKITKYRLAKDLGVHQTTVKNWLDGKTEPKFDTMLKIADVLGVEVREFSHDNKIYLDTRVDSNELITHEQMVEGLKQLRITLSNFHDNLLDIHTDSDEYLLYCYSKLNHNGRKEALKRTEELTQIEKYTKPDESNADE